MCKQTTPESTATVKIESVIEDGQRKVVVTMPEATLAGIDAMFQAAGLLLNAGEGEAPEMEDFREAAFRYLQLPLTPRYTGDVNTLVPVGMPNGPTIMRIRIDE